MLQPELKFRRDKIRSLMVSQGIDAALITCNANLIYTYGCVVSGYLYLPPFIRLHYYFLNVLITSQESTHSLSANRNKLLIC